MQKIFLLTILFSVLILNIQAQEFISGFIKDKNNNALEFVNVSIGTTNKGTVTNSKGFYKLKLKANTPYKIIYSFIGYKTLVKEILLEKNQTKQISIILEPSTEQLKGVNVKKDKLNNRFETLNTRKIKTITSVSGNVEHLISTFAGVSSQNELSSQYSVRGGSYDENMVFVNDIEIYRPILIRSGNQEGLSFLNSDLISSINFSTGGFAPKYGDKMSSVLDIKYKTPKKFELNSNLSLLFNSLSIGNISKNKKLSYIAGFRQKSNKYLLDNLDTKGDYDPQFIDFQSFIQYKFNTKFSLSFLSGYSLNEYIFQPQSRSTKFGTLSDNFNINIGFAGQEKDIFETHLEAFTFKYNINSENTLKFIASNYSSYEKETFDILGQYMLSSIDIGVDKKSDENEVLGRGSYLDHARNKLELNVKSAEIKSIHKISNNLIQFGIKLKKEEIDNSINEWEMRDSAGFSMPYSDKTINMIKYRESKNAYKATHLISYLQNTLIFTNNWARFNITGGLRFNYWDYNKSYLVSPRLSLRIKPEWEKDFYFNLSSGVYYQIPLYKELLNYSGNLVNADIVDAQKSIHYVLGCDYYFNVKNRPFKFSSELYYKQMSNLVPYEVDNVRIRYYGNKKAKGYATGIDMKINGEFIKGIESWLSMSYMKTQEDIKGDNRGYIPRPLDQRLNFSLFFQDYLPKNPSYKMNLTLHYGTGLPFWAPNSQKTSKTFTMPAYKRVDIGFSKILISKEKKPNNFLRYVKSMWLDFEILNLLDIKNTVSYLWVSDIRNNQYAVPNYLTSRKINIKLNVQF